MNYASLTFYNDDEDEYGSVTSKNNEFGHFKAIPGYTIAVDPLVIPYYSRVHIPSLSEISKDGSGVFFAHDTGSAVVCKIASKARGNNYPVIDVFMNVPKDDLLRLNFKYGDVIEYEIL